MMASRPAPGKRRHKIEENLKMTGDQYRIALEQLELRRTEAADFLDVDATTSLRWIKDTYAIPKPIVMLLRIMVKYNIKPHNVISLLQRNGDLTT
jgi:hypothetical protein